MFSNNNNSGGPSSVASGSSSSGSINTEEDVEFFPIPLCTDTRYNFDLGIPARTIFILIEHDGRILNSITLNNGRGPCAVITNQIDIDLFETCDLMPGEERGFNGITHTILFRAINGSGQVIEEQRISDSDGYISVRANNHGLIITESLGEDYESDTNSELTDTEYDESDDDSEESEAENSPAVRRGGPCNELLACFCDVEKDYCSSDSELEDLVEPVGEGRFMPYGS